MRICSSTKDAGKSAENAVGYRDKPTRNLIGCGIAAINATDARLQSLLDQVAISHKPLHIAGKRNAGVLIGEDDWRDIQETLHLLSVLGMRESIVKGIKTPVSKCARSLKW